MLDTIYDNVISILNENGYFEWESKNQGDKVSPFKWCYETGGSLRLPPSVKNDLKFELLTYDKLYNYPHKLTMGREGFIDPF